LKKLGREGTLLQHNKGYIWQTYRQHHNKWGKTKIIFCKDRNETSVFTLLTLTQYSTGIPSQNNKARKKNKIKVIHIRKKEVKLFLFIGNMILYTKDPKDCKNKKPPRLSAM
jgi:hypothetical protein